MLDILPKDCLEKILSYLLDSVYIKNISDVEPFKEGEWSNLRDPYNNSRSFHYNCNNIEYFRINIILKMAKGYTDEGVQIPLGVRNYSRYYINDCNSRLLDWKTKKKLHLTDAPLVLQQKWKPSPYYISIMFMNVCKNTRSTFNTDEYWNIRYSDDYRKGKRYVKIPKDIKQKYKDSIKSTIISRYNNLLENIENVCESYQKKIKSNIRNRNILICLIKEQVDIENEDIVDIEEIPPILSIEIPTSYLSDVGLNDNNPYSITLQQVLVKIERLEHELTNKVKHYKKFKLIERKIHSLFKTIAS